MFSSKLGYYIIISNTNKYLLSRNLFVEKMGFTDHILRHQFRPYFSDQTFDWGELKLLSTFMISVSVQTVKQHVYEKRPWDQFTLMWLTANAQFSAMTFQNALHEKNECYKHHGTLNVLFFKKKKKKMKQIYLLHKYPWFCWT